MQKKKKWVISWRNTSHWVRGNKRDVTCVVKVKTVRRCGGFKENGPRGSGTISRCMTVEVGFEVSYAQDTVHCISWLSVACMNELSQLQYHVYLQTPMLPSIRIMDWTSESLRDFALWDINKLMWATAQLFFFSLNMTVLPRGSRSNIWFPDGATVLGGCRTVEHGVYLTDAGQ